MALQYWQLPENIVVALMAPHSVLNALDNSIVLHQDVSLASSRVVDLVWSEDGYRQFHSQFWQDDYFQDDVVWRESDSGWLFLGAGYFLAYSKATDSARFFTVPEQMDALLVFSYPFLNLLVNLLKPSGYVSLHAAVIGDNDKFVLIPGKQNTGKSTTSANWVLKGGRFLTDDFCFVNIDNPKIAHGFYPSLRLRKEALPLLGNLLVPQSLQQKGSSKYFFSLLSQAPDCFVPRAALTSVFCLHIQKGKPSHLAVSPKTGFEYLASSIAFSVQYRGDSRLCLQAIKKIVRELPVVQVNLSPDMNENYHYLKELIASS